MVDENSCDQQQMVHSWTGLTKQISLDLYLGILAPINMLITIYKKLAYV